MKINKKIIIALLLANTFLIADNLQGSEQMNSYIGKNEINQDFMGQSEKKQRDIKTLKDYKDFEDALLKGLGSGDNTTSPYYLGLLYLTEFQLADGNKVGIDIDKAVKYLQIAYDNGNMLASYNLSMIKLRDKKVDEALFLLDEALAKSATNKDVPSSTRLFLSSVFSSIVMQFKAEDKEAAKKAILYLEKYANKNTPTSLFILANLYHAIGNSTKSNLLLNIACDKNNNNIDKELVGLCGFYMARQIIPEDNNVSETNVLDRNQSSLEKSLLEQNKKAPSLSAQEKILVWLNNKDTLYKIGSLGFVSLVIASYYKLRKKIRNKKADSVAGKEISKKKIESTNISADKNHEEVDI